MITSSINEFSNPAYSGRSALDEDSSETAAVEKASSVVVNGDSDYSRARDLDFSLITSMPNVDAAEGEPRDQVSDEDEDVTLTFLAEQEAIARESKGKDEGEEEEDTEEEEKREMQTKHQEETNQGGIGSDMDVDAAGAGSTMEGVETEVDEEELQPESNKGDNPMDVDQA